jgi:histidinol-phosphate phosphatase family protein
MKITQAVILAGGQGTRLRPLTNSTPKPMIKVQGKPFLEYIITMLKENGISEILLLTGYLHEKIEKHFGDGREFGVKITYFSSPVNDETGTRLKKARHLFNDHFLLLYSDNYWPLNLSQLVRFYKTVKTDALVTVYKNDDNYTKNNMLVNEKGLVTLYDKTHTEKNLNGVDIGFFILSKKIFNNLPQENFSFEKIILPQLIKKMQLAGFLTSHKYYGLSNLKRIPEIKKFMKPKKIIFLDRDGVINKKPKKAEYVTTWKEFVFLPTTLDGLKLLQQKGYDIFIITNQPGIARGMMTKKDLLTINKNFLHVCRQNNIKIKHIYYCPHGWDEGCSCRKPRPGMLFNAALDYHFDLTKAILIGDDIRDIQAGEAAGCKTIFLKKNTNLLTVAKELL